MNCPRCGSRRVVPVAYGLPDESMMQAAEREEIVLGGCVTPIGDEERTFACLECDARLTPDGALDNV